MTIERIPLPRGGGFPLERGQDVPASVIGGLFDLHPYWPLAKLYAKHRGLDVDDTDPASSVIRRGNDLEPLIAHEVRKLHRKDKWKIIKNKDYFRDPDAHIGATPDYFIENDARGLGVLQCKSVGSWRFRHDWTTDNPPFWIALQVATELMLTGARWGLIAVRVSGDYAWDFYEYEIPHHDGAQRRIREAAADFWTAVRECRQPQLNYERDGALINALYPNATPGSVIDLRLDNRVPELLDIIRQAKADAKEAKGKCEKAENEIKDKMGDAEIAIVPGWRVSWKTISKREHLVKATSYRDFRVRRESAA
jgi:predicted phage-related endonuclease